MYRTNTNDKIKTRCLCVQDERIDKRPYIMIDRCDCQIGKRSRASCDSNNLRRNRKRRQQQPIKTVDRRMPEYYKERKEKETKKKSRI